MVVVGALVLVTAGSLIWRTGGLDVGYWIDEAIAVGIASHDLADIPRTLSQDGSPPLYYLLLHGWMQLVGAGEAATRTLSLGFALAAVPVAWWSGRVVFDRRVAALAAAGAAGCPFLTYYAQETRMYSLVAVLSLVAAASFARAFLHGRRGHVVLLGVWLVLLLYTHTWGVFLVAAMALAWLVLWRTERVGGRDGAWLGAAIAVAYAPWMPTLAYQAAHTGAPWAARPLAVELLGAPGALFGYAAAPLLALAVITAVRRRDGRVAPRGGARDERVVVLAAIAVAAAGGAWLVSQFGPAWSARYLAVLFGPLLLALAAVVARGTRWTAVALAGVAALWLASGPPPAKSNVRALAATVAPVVRQGDLVVSTQPEQVPVLYRYVPAGVVYVTPLGVVPDPRLTDWRDALPQLRAGHADRRLLPLLEHVAPGTRILLVTPSGFRRSSPWSRAVRTRTREWRSALRTDPRVRALAGPTRPPPPGVRSGARAELFEVVSRTGTADRRASASSRTVRG